jgi:hypothetical protein
VNSAIYDIHGPWMVIVGESSAVVVTQVRKDDKGFKTAEDWRTVSIAHMLEFSDIGPKSRGRRKSA